MKQLIVLFALTGLFLFPSQAFSQQSSQAQDKQAQVSAILKDSTLMNQMIKEIAANDQLRKTMVSQMMTAVKSDTARMRQMCAMMTCDPAMCGMMMKSMDCCQMKMAGCQMGPDGCPMMNKAKGKATKPAKSGSKAKKASPKQ